MDGRMGSDAELASLFTRVCLNGRVAHSRGGSAGTLAVVRGVVSLVGDQREARAFTRRKEADPNTESWSAPSILSR